MSSGLLVLLVVAGTAAAPTASAPVQAETGSAAPVEALLQCRENRDIAARLACFDRTAETLRRSIDEGVIGVVNRKVAQARRQRSFGLTPSAEPRSEPAPAIDVAPIEEVKSAIQSLMPASGQTGRWNLQLANGMLWQTTEPLARLPRAGTATTIRRVRLGGYRMTVEGQSRSYSVKRLR